MNRDEIDIIIRAIEKKKYELDNTSEHERKKSIDEYISMLQTINYELAEVVKTLLEKKE